MRKRSASVKMNEGPMEAREFEALVRASVKGLPAEFRRALENITIVVREEPSARQKKTAGTGRGEDLLGLYEGVPLTERTHDYGNVLPDKITIFRGPVTRSCQGNREMKQAVRDTVLHELAHYFGISDEHMLEDGTY